MNGEGFTEGEKGDRDREKGEGDGARVPKWGEAVATGGAPDLYVWVSRLFLFAATMKGK